MIASVIILVSYAFLCPLVAIWVSSVVLLISSLTMGNSI